jgi:hypothetical protein
VLCGHVRLSIAGSGVKNENGGPGAAVGLVAVLARCARP